ncbi:MAG: RNA-binding protein [Candidatus Riflebacteria bacterium]|mgnify:CR=1 FL=1|nr:RNA-binding protein [Candidatus Riflebacteria bacterium]
MPSKIFVGNLPFSVDNHQLEEAFKSFGEVISAKVIQDRRTGRSRGYGFVEFSEQTAAEAAVDGKNGQEMSGRKLTVSLAKKQE